VIYSLPFLAKKLVAVILKHYGFFTVLKRILVALQTVLCCCNKTLRAFFEQLKTALNKFVIFV
jgi:hypothetical protein